MQETITALKENAGVAFTNGKETSVGSEQLAKTLAGLCEESGRMAARISALEKVARAGATGISRDDVSRMLEEMRDRLKSEILEELGESRTVQSANPVTPAIPVDVSQFERRQASFEKELDTLKRRMMNPEAKKADDLPEKVSALNAEVSRLRDLIAKMASVPKPQGVAKTAASSDSDADFEKLTKRIGEMAKQVGELSAQVASLREHAEQKDIGIAIADEFRKLSMRLRLILMGQVPVEGSLPAEPKLSDSPTAQSSVLFGIKLKPAAMNPVSREALGERVIEILNINPDLSNTQIAEILTNEFPFNSKGRFTHHYVSVLIHNFIYPASPELKERRWRCGNPNRKSKPPVAGAIPQNPPVMDIVSREVLEARVAEIEHGSPGIKAGAVAGILTKEFPANKVGRGFSPAFVRRLRKPENLEVQPGVPSQLAYQDIDSYFTGLEDRRNGGTPILPKTIDSVKQIISLREKDRSLSQTAIAQQLGMNNGVVSHLMKVHISKIRPDLV